MLCVIIYQYVLSYSQKIRSSIYVSLRLAMCLDTMRFAVPDDKLLHVL